MPAAAMALPSPGSLVSLPSCRSGQGGANALAFGTYLSVYVAGLLEHPNYRLWGGHGHPPWQGRWVVFCDLLQTRYGKGLTLHVSVGAAYQQQLLPPLTLQLLVENAVKHNVTSPNRPLRIAIFVDSSGYLTVRNNL